MEFVAASEHALKIAKIAAQAAYDKKAENIVLLDVSEHLVITDIFLIASADNERQVGAIVDAIEAALTPEEFRGYCKGNAFKYTWREKHKGQGDTDISKAIFYLKRISK